MKKLRNFLPSQRCRVPLSIYRKKIVLTRRAFWDLENFSTFSKNFFSRLSPPLCRQSQPSDDEIIDRSFSPVLQLVDFKSNAQVTTRAHDPIDEIPVTGFLPCKSPVDYTILTWDIFRSTDPRQRPLSPDSRFASPIQVDRKIASISFTITSNHRSRRSPAKYNFFFFFLIQFSLISLSLSFLSFQHN